MRFLSEAWVHIIKSFVLSQNNSRFPLLLTLSSHVNLKLRILQSSSSAPYLYYYHSLLLTMKSFVTNGRRVSFFFFFFFFCSVNSSFSSSNIPSEPACGVYVCYARACFKYQDFVETLYPKQATNQRSRHNRCSCAKC